MHVIYTVRSSANAGRGIRKRNTEEFHTLLEPGARLLSHARTKRSRADLEGVGVGGKGTNIARVQLNFTVREGDVSIGTNVTTKTEIPLIPVIVSLVVIIIVCILLVIFFVRRRQKRSTPPPSPTKTITIVANGYSKVVSVRHYKHDSNEV